MAAGKNKRLSKGGGKRSKGKKIVDPFSRKEWYTVQAPAAFTVRKFTQTIVNRTAGNNIASEALKGRVFEANLADLNKDEDQGFKKFRLRVDEVQGRNCLTNFHGMDITRDKLSSLVRKWQSTIEAYLDVKTSDGFLVRVFVIGFTKRRPNSTTKTAYAQTAQVRRIRRKMMDIVKNETATVELKDFVHKLIADSISKQIEKACQGIYPLQNVFVRKVKLLAKPKYDYNKLMDVHAETSRPEEAGVAVKSA